MDEGCGEPAVKEVAENMKCGCHSHGGFLTADGLAETAQRELKLNALDAMPSSGYLDKGVSVSALIEPPEPLFVDEILDQQYRRFHSGL